jgi:hypothetical protein
LPFFEQYQGFDDAAWDKVIWSDVSKIALSNTNNREYYWKEKGTSLKESHIKQTLKFGDGSIMVWGAITSKGVGELVRIEKNVTSEEYIKILRKGLLGTYRKHGLSSTTSIFMQDNAPAHCSATTKEWLRVHKISVIK